MDEKKLRRLLEQTLSEEDLEKLEAYLTEEKLLRMEKIRKIKELIEKGEYDIPAEEVAEKIIEFFKKNQ
ncbi:flagellar biosynthesis anti-sigma factor FlgM [Persephonella sp.]